MTNPYNKTDEGDLFSRLTHHATNLGKAIGEVVTKSTKQLQDTVKKATQRPSKQPVPKQPMSTKKTMALPQQNPTNNPLTASTTPRVTNPRVTTPRVTNPRVTNPRVVTNRDTRPSLKGGKKTKRKRNKKKLKCWSRKNKKGKKYVVCKKGTKKKK